jgi:hypothetical protein
MADGKKHSHLQMGIFAISNFAMIDKITSG